MNIGIFGGSFNPVHYEHLCMVCTAIKELALDKVIIMPSCVTPLKEGRMVVSGEDRLNMCRLTFAKVERAEVSDYELKKGGISYSYLTCLEMAKRYPDERLYFIVGADMLECFPKWKNPETILECATLAVCARSNSCSIERAKKSFAEGLGEKRLSRVIELSFAGEPVSSTRVRTVAALGEHIEGYLEEDTAKYIRERGLYRILELEKCLKTVKEYLSFPRWGHTVRVAITAAENAPRFGISEEKAIIAAALHDCAKYMKENDGLLSGFVCPENVPHPVVHQYAGAYVAEKAFNITDREILDAIKYHASGRAGMGKLEKLIYLSDMLEYGRDFEGVEELRNAFAIGLDEGMLAALKHQLSYLKKQNMPVEPLTEQAYEYLLNKRKTYDE